MQNDAFNILDESIKLEMLIADIYEYFQSIFKEDSTFWWLLTNEEKNHASLLQRAKKYFETNEFPEELLYSSKEILHEANRSLSLNIEKYKSNPPTREIASQFALDMENNAYEIHFQMLIKKKTDSEILKYIRLLNFADKDHAERIKEYFKI